MPVEEILSRELREVADRLPVPALPPLPQEPPRTQRHWPPLLVAAAAAIIVAAAAVVATSYRDDTAPDTDPVVTPTPTPVPENRPLTAVAPIVPYVFASKLYVDGEQVPGSWFDVSHAGDAWVAEQNNLTMQWGTDAEPHDIPGDVTLLPHLSPDGTLLAVSTTDDGGQVLLIDTQSGDTINTFPTGTTNADDADAFGVVAVTNDAQVFLASDAEQRMWLAADGGQETVDLAGTAPGQQVEDATPAGLLVFNTARDGEPDAYYLADVSDSGELTEPRTIPGSEIAINPSGSWLAYGGSFGGESQTIPEITAQAVDGGRQLTLRPPDERTLFAMTWEDDDLLLAELSDGSETTGLARCSIREKRCVEIELP